MAQSLIGGKQAGASLSSQNGTWYLPITQGGNFTFTATENQAQFAVGQAGTLSLLTCHIDSNAKTSTTTVKSRVNGADGNQSVSITSTATGVFQDVTNSDSISAGDDICASITAGPSLAQTIVIDGIWFAYDTGGNFASFFMSGLVSIAPSFSTNSASAYNGLSGSIGVSFSTIENDKKFTARAPGTFNRLFCYISANTRSTTSTVSFRINGANGNQIISVSAGTTGLFEETSNTDAVSSGDDVNYAITNSTGGGSLTFHRLGISFIGANNQIDMCAFSNSSVQRISSSTDVFPDFFGPLGVGNTSESRAQIEMPIDGRWSRLRMKIFSNSGNTITVITRKNGADGNQSISAASGTSGLFEDTSAVDDVVAGDTINIKLSSATTTASFAYFGMRFNEPFVPTPGSSNRRVIIMQ